VVAVKHGDLAIKNGVLAMKLDEFTNTHGDFAQLNPYFINEDNMKTDFRMS